MIEVTEDYFAGLWQESYCFPSIVDGKLYYSKRGRLVIENLLANEAGNWRLSLYSPEATVKNQALPAHRKWDVVGTTVSFLRVKNREEYTLVIEVHMTDPWAKQAYQRAVDEYLLDINMTLLVVIGFFGGGALVAHALIGMMMAEAEMKIAELGTLGMFDTYIFSWAPGDGDFSLLNVPIYAVGR